jgi:hypothetical protein
MDYANELAYEAEPRSREDYELRPVDDMMAYVREYTRERPEMVALACLGIGFVLGWKLRPW